MALKKWTLKQMTNTAEFLIDLCGFIATPLFKSAFDDGGNPKNLKVLFVKTLIMLIRLFLN